MTFYSWLQGTIPSNSIQYYNLLYDLSTPSSAISDNLVISRIINKAIADFSENLTIDDDKLKDAINRAIPALSDEELEEILRGETN